MFFWLVLFVFISQKLKQLKRANGYEQLVSHNMHSCLKVSVHFGYFIIFLILIFINVDSVESFNMKPLNRWMKEWIEIGMIHIIITISSQYRPQRGQTETQMKCKWKNINIFRSNMLKIYYTNLSFGPKLPNAYMWMEITDLDFPFSRSIKLSYRFLEHMPCLTLESIFKTVKVQCRVSCDSIMHKRSVITFTGLKSCWRFLSF